MWCKKRSGLVSLCFALGLVWSSSGGSQLAWASAANPVGELSVMGSYSKSNYGNNAYSTSRRYTAALALNVTAITSLEMSYTTSQTFFNDDPIQTSLVKEQALGASIIQLLVPYDWAFQPYVKAGGAQYNRQQTGTIAGVATNPSESKSPSAVLGGGLRIYFLRNFSLRVEGVAYLPNMRMAEAKNNVSVQGGFGWQF